MFAVRLTRSLCSLRGRALASTGKPERPLAGMVLFRCQHDYTGKESKDLQALIENNRIMMFSKTYCGFCARVKQIFSELNVEASIIELDLLPDEGFEIQQKLYKMTGQRTVPNIFIKGQHVGGCSDLELIYNNGELHKVLHDG